jgi:hypothetical protein
LWRALFGIGGIDRDDVLINMIIVHVMAMAIMQIIDMTLMSYCRVPAIGTVPVRMVRMMIPIANGHCDFPLFLAGGRRLLRFGSTLDGAFHQTKDVSVGKRIIDVLCLAPSFDQSHVVQRLKTSRNSRQLFAFQLRQFGYAGLTAGEPRKQSKSSRIAKSLEHRRRVFQVGLIR